MTNYTANEVMGNGTFNGGGAGNFNNGTNWSDTYTMPNGDKVEMFYVIPDCPECDEDYDEEDCRGCNHTIDERLEACGLNYNDFWNSPEIVEVNAA